MSYSFEKTLEFRGILLSHHLLYLTELGAPIELGSVSSADLPQTWPLNEDWQVEVIQEKEVTITSTFKVNAVFIRFLATTQERLDALIASYRKKTFRAGG